MKIRPVGAELFHADLQTVRHGAANSGFRNFAKASKKRKLSVLFYRHRDKYEPDIYALSSHA